jgi:putative exosortase-associated protein (TIGR04073 family)
MFRRAVVLTVIAVLALSAVTVYAEEKNAFTKLTRGFANMLTGSIEIPKQIYLVSKEREPITGATYGLAKGICLGVLRTGAGVYDSLAFAIPPYDKPVFEPEFVFEGWEAQHPQK